MNLKLDHHNTPSSRRLSWAAVLSVGIHLGIFLGLFLVAQTKTKIRPLAVVPFSAQDLQALKTKIKAERKIKIARDTRHQIVNTDQHGFHEVSQENYYLGKSNQTFAQQTAARRNGSYSPGARGEGGAKTNPKTASIDPRQLGLGKNIFTAPKTTMAQRPGNKQGEWDAVGPAASSDFIENLPLGDLAQLNTQEFKYFGFYDRIRQKLEQFWGMALKEKAQGLYRQGRHIAAGQRITSLQVVLDHQGNIIKVLIKAASGIRELDEAAIESFRKAGPFPNPPQGMLKEGYALIEWGFVVKS
ncbi:MAG: TonB family protein [Bacteriovoracaceae bacterium]|nr:TonB family protein [Bacteriovoracaceae bacterium]